MVLDEAIYKEKQAALTFAENAYNLSKSDESVKTYAVCTENKKNADYHDQIALWLQELKQYREEFPSVSLRLYEKTRNLCRCKKSFYVEKSDKGVAENKSMFIPEGSFWKIDYGGLKFSGDENMVRLINDFYGWIEITENTFKETFKK